jgi:hypothetical protein
MTVSIVRRGGGVDLAERPQLFIAGVHAHSFLQGSGHLLQTAMS